MAGAYIISIMCRADRYGGSWLAISHDHQSFLSRLSILHLAAKPSAYLYSPFSFPSRLLHEIKLSRLLLIKYPLPDSHTPPHHSGEKKNLDCLHQMSLINCSLNGCPHYFIFCSSILFLIFFFGNHIFDSNRFF